MSGRFIFKAEKWEPGLFLRLGIRLIGRVVLCQALVMGSELRGRGLVSRLCLIVLSLVVYKFQRSVAGYLTVVLGNLVSLMRNYIVSLFALSGVELFVSIPT